MHESLSGQLRFFTHHSLILCPYPCHSVLDSQPELFIHIAPDKANNTITLTDSGIGMTKVRYCTFVWVGYHQDLPMILF